MAVDQYGLSEMQGEVHLEGAKDCPFCGNDYIKVKMNVVSVASILMFWTSPVCPDCGCTFDPTCVSADPLRKENSKEQREAGIKDSLLVWNNREGESNE